MIRHLLRNARRGRESGAPSVSAAIAADLAAVVLGAGGTVLDVVGVLSTIGPIEIRPSFAAVGVRIAAGGLLSESLHQEISSLGIAFHPLIGALTMADDGGAPVGSILQHLSDDARQARDADADRQAKELSVRLLVPLVVTLLPAVVLGAVVPIMLVAFASLELG